MAYNIQIILAFSNIMRTVGPKYIPIYQRKLVMRKKNQTAMKKMKP